MNWPKKREKKKRSSMESKVEKTEHGFYVMPIQGFVFGTFRYWLHTTGGLFVSYLGGQKRKNIKLVVLRHDIDSGFSHHQ